MCVRMMRDHSTDAGRGANTMIMMKKTDNKIKKFFKDEQV